MNDLPDSPGDSSQRSDKHKLNLETAQISWVELQPHFASGRLVTVAPALDLVAVAAAFAADEKTALQKWLSQGSVHPVSDEEARTWHDNAATLWAVVVKPWVLVQEHRN